MLNRCYYKILGISTQASQAEIKKAFRELALRFHPDRNPQDPAAPSNFRLVLEAYETLVSPVKRNEYDRRQNLYEPQGRRGQGFAECETPPHQEILKDFFGLTIRHWTMAGARRNDLRFDLQVPKTGAQAGCHEVIDYQRLIFCRDCLGVDLRAKKALSSCAHCHGDGQVEEHCSLHVWIPPGSKNGTRLRVPGAGDQPNPGMTAGDLVVLIHLVD